MPRLALLLLATTIRGATPLPVTFEPNLGQAAPTVAFLSRTSQYRVFFTRSGVVMAAKHGATLRIDLVGANPIEPSGDQRLPGQSNYLIGSDPERWRTGIPNFEEVRYRNLYPGIDAVWHGREGDIEHDFLIGASADPSHIQLRVSGEAAKLDLDGNIAAGEFRLHKPRAYQDGREILCHYKLRGQRLGFVLGRYDHTRPLTIDPVLSFSTFLGGRDSDSAAAIALDSSGNIYVAGTTASANFPISSNAFQTKPGGGVCFAVDQQVPCTDVFVTKLSGDGNTLLYSTYLGGSGNDSATAIAVSVTDAVYLTGVAGGSDFPKLMPLVGSPAPTRGPFVAELSPNGATIVYATSLGNDSQSANAVAVDAAGSVYIAGSSNGGLPVVRAFQSAFDGGLVFRTADSGATWRAFMDGLPIDLVSAFTIDPSNPQVLYLGTISSGPFKSTDGGAHWIPIQNGLSSTNLFSTSIVVDPSSPQTLYLTTAATLISPSSVFKSNDGGATWAPAGSGIPLGTVMAGVNFTFQVAVDPKNPSTLYVATTAGIYKSVDGAATWRPTGLAMLAKLVVVDPSNPTTVYAGTSYGVMKSTDGGMTWSSLTNGFTQSITINALAIDARNPQRLYAAATGDTAVYATQDGGAHWTKAPGPLPEYLLVDPLMESRIWAGTSDGIAVSNDYGATWTKTSFPDIDVPVVAADPPGAVYAIANGWSQPDAFAMKLDASGSNLIYSTYLGGIGYDAANAIAVDVAGHAYIAGWTDSPDFPVAGNLARRGGGFDAFITVLDPTGTRLVWSSYYGGSGRDSASAIALDKAGNVHITGWTDSVDFPLQHASQTSSSGGANTLGVPPRDAFAAKLKGDGSAVMFSTYLGGSGDDYASAVGADAAGNTYIAGTTMSKDLPVMNAVQSTLLGSWNAFAAAWNDQTGALQYATYVGGSASDRTTGLAVDPMGNAYVAGTTDSSDFPRKYALQYSYGGGAGDAFLFKIAPTGSGPAIAVSGITNAASYTSTVAPGEIISIFGSNLAVTPAVASGQPLPTQLNNLKVTVNGLAAPLIYASPLQVNVQVPFETQPGAAQIQVTGDAGTATANVQVSLTAPGIFTVNAQGTGAGAIEHGVNYQLVTDSNPATPGEIVSIYCTGLGAVVSPVASGSAAASPVATVAHVDVSIAGIPAKVTYAGLAPGFAGLYQVNAEVPQGIPTGNQTLQITAGGVASNTVTLAVR